MPRLFRVYLHFLGTGCNDYAFKFYNANKLSLFNTLDLISHLRRGHSVIKSVKFICICTENVALFSFLCDSKDISSGLTVKYARCTKNQIAPGFVLVLGYDLNTIKKNKKKLVPNGEKLNDQTKYFEFIPHTLQALHKFYRSHSDE